MTFEELKKLPLYHGSKEGIVLPIRPCSRAFCDFGAGFYMGTEQIQTIGLVSEYTNARTYSVAIDFNTVSQKDVLFLDDESWLHAVIAFRGNFPEFTRLPQIRFLTARVQTTDFVVGRIADDRLRPAVKLFEQGMISDKVLLECLRSVDYGYQVVAKTEKACAAIQILANRSLTPEEKVAGKAFGQAQREKGDDIIQIMNQKYRGEGKLIGELIEYMANTQNPILAMESAWEAYFSRPKTERNGIPWEGKKLSVAVFEDCYLKACKDGGYDPKKQIFDHFWKVCVGAQGYEPKHITKKYIAH